MDIDREVQWLKFTPNDTDLLGIRNGMVQQLP